MTDHATQRPGVSDCLLELTGSLISAGAFAVAFGAGARWAFDAIAGTQGLQDIARALMGGLVGLVFGAPLGPWIIARFRSRLFSLRLGYLGALIGAGAGLAAVTALSLNDAAGAGPWVAYALVVAVTVLLGNAKRARR